MHELGICDALRKMVSRIAAQEGADSVTSITVEVGTLSGVVPRFLADGWEAVTDGSVSTAARCSLPISTTCAARSAGAQSSRRSQGGSSRSRKYCSRTEDPAFLRKRAASP